MAQKIQRLTACAASLLLAACNAGGLQQVSQSHSGAFEVSLAPVGERMAVAWYDTRDGNAEIYLRLVDTTGMPDSPEYRLTDSPEQSYEASIDTLGRGVGLAWYEKSARGAHQAQMGFWNGGDELVWQFPVTDEDRESRIPVLRTYRDRVFCAWVEKSTSGEEYVMGGWWDINGRALASPVRLAPAGPTTWNLNATIDDDGVAYIIFDAISDTQAEELFLASLNDGQVALTRLTRDDGFASKYPDLVMTSGVAAITWFDERDGNQEVYLLVAPTQRLNHLVDVSPQRITRSAGASIGAYLAPRDGQFGLAWSDDTNGPYDVYFQIFDTSGEAVSAASRITASQSQSLIPALRSWGNGFLVAWNEVAPADTGYHSDDTRSEVFLRHLP